MKKSRFTEEQMVAILREADAYMHDELRGMVALFPATEAASFVTGETIAVDGGFLRA